MEKGLLGSLTLINFLVLVWGEINFVSEFCILQESFENVIPFDGGERANFFDILYFHLYKDEISSGVEKNRFHNFLNFRHFVLYKGPCI